MSKRTTRTRDSKDHKGSMLFRATDFASLMRPTMICSTIFGFFPCIYKSEEYVFSKKKFVYSVFATCLHLVLQIYNFAFYNFYDTTVVNITYSMAQNFFLLLDGSLPLLLIVAPLSLSAMVEQLSKLSRTLSRQDFNDTAKVIHTVYSVIAVFLAVTTPLYYWQLRGPLLPELINFFLVLPSTASILCYLSFVRVLGACLKKLNKDLKRLNGPTPDLRVELAEKQLSRRQTAMLLTKVKYYEEVHEKISDAIEHLNTLFRTINIISTTATFILVTFDLYDIIDNVIVTQGVRTTEETITLLLASSFTAVRFGIFCVMIWFCEAAANDAAEITTTIHDCVSYCADDTVKRELKYFSLQVMHRNITFTTKAFDINGKLLSQILSAIFTYMMILYQFLMSSNCTN